MFSVLVFFMGEWVVWARYPSREQALSGLRYVQDHSPFPARLSGGRSATIGK